MWFYTVITISTYTGFIFIFWQSIEALVRLLLSSFNSLHFEFPSWPKFLALKVITTVSLVTNIFVSSWVGLTLRDDCQTKCFCVDGKCETGLHTDVSLLSTVRSQECGVSVREGKYWIQEECNKLCMLKGYITHSELIRWTLNFLFSSEQCCAGD
jgi:hypothetical protein